MSVCTGLQCKIDFLLWVMVRKSVKALQLQNKVTSALSCNMVRAKRSQRVSCRSVEPLAPGSRGRTSPKSEVLLRMGCPNLTMHSIRTCLARTGMKLPGLEVGVSSATLERRWVPLWPREGTILVLCLHNAARLKKR